MSRVKSYPRPGYYYSLRTIIDQLRIDDAPCLLFEGKPIARSHVTNEQLLAVPGMAETIWQFRYTTNERVPVFEHYAAHVPVTKHKSGDYWELDVPVTESSSC